MARLNIEENDDDIKDIVSFTEDYRSEMIPSVLSGWLLLQRSNLSAQERATVLASAKNSLELADVERALRDQWAGAATREGLIRRLWQDLWEGQGLRGRRGARRRRG